MQADRNERLVSDDTRRRHSTQTLVTGIAVLILAAGAWLLAPGDREAPDDTPTVTPEPAPLPVPPRPEPAQVIREAPDIPEPATEPEPIVDSAVEEPPQPVVDDLPPPPPTPEEIDAQIRTAIADAGLVPVSPLDGALAAPYLLDRAVSSIDQVARGLVPRRTLNLPRPKGPFATQREGQTYRMDPRGYGRYDALVAAITALPPATLASLFHRYRAALTTAYATLGYPEDAMDNTLIAALDAVIEAPVREEPPQLRSKGAMWAYEDSRLEGASDLHRQLLRTGPENTRALQGWAGQLRTALLNP